MNFSIKEINLSPLQQEFGDINFSYFETDNDGFMGCISASFESRDVVIQLWSAIQNMAAAYLKPQGNYAKWNLYFAIFCVGKVPTSSKYKIQNDKFAMRKILFDGLDKLPTVAEIQSALDKVILGTDLEIIDFSKEKDREVPDFELKQVINGLPLDMAAASKEARQNAIFELIQNHLN